MAVTRTFSIIKPDATRRNLTGAVTKMLEDAGLRVVASKRIQMTEEEARTPRDRRSVLPLNPATGQPGSWPECQPSRRSWSQRR